MLTQQALEPCVYTRTRMSICQSMCFCMFSYEGQKFNFGVETQKPSTLFFETVSHQLG